LNEGVAPGFLISVEDVRAHLLPILETFSTRVLY
jgi:hypothetical protein